MATKYCPECGTEYEEWAVKCLDCGAALTEEKPIAKLKSGKKDLVSKGGRKYVKEPLVAVAAFANAMEAQFSKGILEAEGIPSMVTDADAILLNGQNSSTKKGVSLVVRESDLQTAKEILESIERDIPEDRAIEQDDSSISK